ncbi:MAG: hypothetical protein RBU31_08530 [Syntrophales bacterium]|jgi:hypothetical protein|nr:hypothetical protein [Syntrophales bacterium]
MKNTQRILFIMLLTSFFITALTSASMAVDPQPVTGNMKKTPRPVVTDKMKKNLLGEQITICKDPTVSNFSISKTLINNTARFTLTGRICNNGPGDYNQPDNPLEGHFNIYAAYGPLFSYPASGDAKFYTQTVGPILKKGQCVSLTQVFTRGQVLQWGFKDPNPGEKQMKLLFEFFVRDAKGTLGTVSMPKGLDCNPSNNLLSKTFDMMISTTKP